MLSYTRERERERESPTTHSFNHNPSTSFSPTHNTSTSPKLHLITARTVGSSHGLVCSPTPPSSKPPLSLSSSSIAHAPHRSADMEMPPPQLAPDHVCYVHCNFCNTILAVSVPRNNLFNIVTVRCGHCTNLLSVNMGALLQSFPLQDLQLQNQNLGSQGSPLDCGSSSKCGRAPVMYSIENNKQEMLPIRPPEKRQRVPSAYNRFIKEEIQRIKANNPDISHREAFSAAAKNWAHFPHIHFGLTFDGNKQAKLN